METRERSSGPPPGAEAESSQQIGDLYVRRRNCTGVEKRRAKRRRQAERGALEAAPIEGLHGASGRGTALGAAGNGATKRARASRASSGCSGQESSSISRPILRGGGCGVDPVRAPRTPLRQERGLQRG